MNRCTCNVFLFCVVQQSERAYEHPGFVLRLILQDREIKFEPDLRLYEEALLHVYDSMLSSVSMVPRVETKLFPDWVRGSCVRVCIYCVFYTHQSVSYMSLKVKTSSFTMFNIQHHDHFGGPVFVLLLNCIALFRELFLLFVPLSLV